MAREIYEICVIPVDGKTLLARTKQEWSLGYDFQVIWSESPLFKAGSYITSKEIDDQERYHPVLFKVEFDVQSNREYFAEQSEATHGFSVNAAFLTKGQ